MGDTLPMPAGRTKKIIFALVPTLVLALLAAICGEVVLRAQNSSIAAITGVAVWKTAAWQDLTYHWDVYHPTLGWTNLPNYRSNDDVPFEITINSQGLRAKREYPRRAPPGLKRILVFGDSSVFGEEVDDHESLPAALERAMEDVEVLNFGVHGYGMGQAALRLEEEGFALNPDHVVVVYLTYDFVRDPSPDFLHSKPVFQLDDGSLRITNVPVPEYSRRPWVVRHSYAAAWVWGRSKRLKPTTALGMAEGLAVTSAILDRVIEKCGEREIPVTLVHIADAPTISALHVQSGERQRIESIREMLRERDAPLLDLFEYLDDLFIRRAREVTAPNGHWAGEGNELIAKKIAAFLADQPPFVQPRR